MNDKVREALEALVESASHVVHKNDCMCGWCCTMASDIQTARAALAALRDTERAAVERVRAAFVAGAKWGTEWAPDDDDAETLKADMAEATRLYPMPETGGGK